MKIAGTGTETYILLSGVVVSTSIRLSDNVFLEPADTCHLDLKTTLAACVRPDDIAVAAAFIPRVSAQLKIKAPTSEELAVFAWNSLWDLLLLSALFQTEIGFNLQSDVPAGLISGDTNLRATNFHMRGLITGTPYRVTTDDSRWIANHFAQAREFVKKEQFQTAVHCLATYRWHSMPRVQLAILWAGIEGMFGATTEIRFRISLCIARFLHPDDYEPRLAIFEAVKKLYDSRSAAVHGSKLKTDSSTAISKSADLLSQLLRRSVEFRSLPNEKNLLP